MNKKVLSHPQNVASIHCSSQTLYIPIVMLRPHLKWHLEIAVVSTQRITLLQPDLSMSLRDIVY